ncbi:helix-turn-helix domain-containing protein [Microbispora hainanensis]|uniref:Helix-turn-helix domain-containing protein n=1 Tax=Microbispora hainanensis TaxID=568844 RepID=A0A544YV85_9ACTN|nr:helix-turn-helix domain-containing protein [Microbispora hainanensis]TQS20668.1 helix-turn-helix domain-containing protein [Microbispora hainanensis]
MDGPVLTVEEAAAQLKVSRWTLYKFIRSGQLKTFKAGRRRLVPVTALTGLVDLLLEEAA